MARAVLLFPPQWCPTHPYLALPSLTAYLRQHGHSVFQRDLNIEFFRHVLSIDYLEGRVQRVGRRFLELDKSTHLSSSEQDEYQALFQATSKASYVLENLPKALQVLSSNEFYNISRLEHSLWIINSALSIVSSSYFPTTISLTSYNTCYSPFSSREIIKATEDKDKNPLTEILPDLLNDWIKNKQPDLIGISITGETQIIPGFTIGRWLKQSFPSVHIVFGGSIISRWHDVLLNMNHLFDHCLDSVILFEGEEPLHQLLGALQVGSSLNEVPNLIYKAYDGSIVRTESKRTQVKAKDLPTPDFEGFPLNSYLSPETVLPILSSRGCYWNRCTFCDHSYVYGNRYSPAGAVKVVDDIVKLSAKYRVRHFAFSDECVSPRILRGLAEEIEGRGVDIDWVAAARFEMKLREKSFCEQLARTGLKALYLGLESASNRILKDMDKGTNINSIAEICCQLSEANIWTHLFTMFGFPTENDIEALETNSFFKNNEDIVHSAGASYFGLSKYSAIYNDPESYGIRVLEPPDNQDMTLFYAFDRNSLLADKTREIMEEFNKKLKPSMPLARVSQILERGHLLLYLSKYEIDNLKTICQEPINQEKDQAPGICPETTFSISPLAYQADLNFGYIFSNSSSVARAQKCSVLFHIRLGTLFYLSNLARDVLECCRNGLTYSEMVNIVSKNSSAKTGTLRSSLSVFLLRLHEAQLLTFLN